MGALENQVDAVYLVKCKDPQALTDDTIESYVEVKRENAIRWRHCRIRMACLVDRILGELDGDCLEGLNSD